MSGIRPPTRSASTQLELSSLNLKVLVGSMAPALSIALSTSTSFIRPRMYEKAPLFPSYSTTDKTSILWRFADMVLLDISRSYSIRNAILPATTRCARAIQKRSQVSRRPEVQRLSGRLLRGLGTSHHRFVECLYTRRRHV